MTKPHALDRRARIRDWMVAIVIGIMAGVLLELATDVTASASLGLIGAIFYMRFFRTTKTDDGDETDVTPDRREES